MDASNPTDSVGVGVGVGVGDTDEALAARTIPRGRAAADHDPTPAVDPALWLDHVRWWRRREEDALERLVDAYEDYARALASRLRRSGESAEDLAQVALEALVVALNRFDPERGLPFPAFATPTIMGAVRRHFRDHGWLIRVPRQVHEFAVAQREAYDRLQLELGRVPTVDELAAALGVEAEQVLEAQDAIHARDARSLDVPGEDGRPLSEHLGAQDRAMLLAEDRIAVLQAMVDLDDPARELLERYFLLGWSQTQIAEELGVSQMQVSRLISAILRRLRRNVRSS